MGSFYVTLHYGDIDFDANVSSLHSLPFMTLCFRVMPSICLSSSFHFIFCSCSLLVESRLGDGQDL